jgi:SAM-dependent methyltransferase
MSDSSPSIYWEERARRFAQRGAGLRAVCSYGMPAFHNAGIDLCQRLALRRWLDVAPGTSVLDVGCGVGRWSRLMARRGAKVTGIDLAPTMVETARRRAEQEGVATRCRFLVGDLSRLDLPDRFSLILGVTVLQHILDPHRLRDAIANLAAHLEVGARVVLLEAAPSGPRREIARCDTAVFRARDTNTYLSAFADAGLQCVSLHGVDPAPFRTLFLPHYGRLPRPLALLGLASVTALSLPVDFLAGRRWVDRSWHKVFVLMHEEGARDAA